MTNLDLRSVRAIVTDADVLGRIDPAAVAAYLQRAGWFQAHERTGGAIWTRWVDDRGLKLLVPNDPTFGDYPIRMAEVLTALAITEDRSQLAVLADLCASTHAGDTDVGDQARTTVGVEALRHLLEKATPRPWQARPDPHHEDETLVVTDVRWGGANYVKVATCDQPKGEVPGQADAELIVAAVHALPSLMDELERWRTRAESAASLYETAVEERDALRRRAEAAEGDWQKAEADLEGLRRTTEAGREFHRLWLELQQGIASFDLHNRTVTQFEAAEATFGAALKEDRRR